MLASAESPISERPSTPPAIVLTPAERRAAYEAVRTRGAKNPYKSFYYPNPYTIVGDTQGYQLNPDTQPGVFFEGLPGKLPILHLKLCDIIVLEVLGDGEDSSVYKDCGTSPLCSMLIIANSPSSVKVKALEGLEKIHWARVVHQDIATRNILISNGNVIWIDFDVCRTHPCTTRVKDRRSFVHEKALLWSWLFVSMLPDQAISVFDELF